MKLNKNGDISERNIHLTIMQWVQSQPQLKNYVLHFPNEGKRTLQYGKLLKNMGMRKGAADLFIAIPKNEYHGAWIELKTKSGKATKYQLEFLEDMKKQNYFTAVTYGLDDAINTVSYYCSLNSYSNPINF